MMSTRDLDACYAKQLGYTWTDFIYAQSLGNRIVGMGKVRPYTDDVKSCIPCTTHLQLQGNIMKDTPFTDWISLDTPNPSQQVGGTDETWLLK